MSDKLKEAYPPPPCFKPAVFEALMECIPSHVNITWINMHRLLLADKLGYDILPKTMLPNGSFAMIKKRQRPSCQISMQVPFHDLDPMQVVWHGNYYKYFDQARFKLFYQCGVELYTLYKKSNLLLPVTRTTCKHIAPLRHNDQFTCTATLIEARIKIIIDFEIRRTFDDTLCARARGEQVAVKIPENELLLEIPESIQNALNGAV